MAAHEKQVRVRLSTQHANLQPPKDTGAIVVPTSLGRAHLSTLVNDLLSTSTAEKFDFFIDGYPLRTTIEQWLVSHHASAETVLSVEYSRAQAPPQHQASFPHDDCIGAVDLLSASAFAASNHSLPRGQERILSASHDGCVRVWNMSGVALASSEGAASPDGLGNRVLADGSLPFLQAARFVSPSRVIASGWQLYLRIWDYQEDDEALGEGSATLSPAIDLYGHCMPVNAIDVLSPQQRVLSASDDATARLWTTNIENAPKPDPEMLPSASNKRRKLSSGASTKRCGPLTTLSAHQSAVKAAVFHPKDPTAAYTASADSTVLTWDLETATSVSSRTPGGLHVPLRSLCALPELGLLATGTVDRRVLLIDPREGATRSNVGSLRGHRNVVSAVEAEPGGGYGLASASFDGCVHIWDVRVAKEPLAGGDGRGSRASTFKIPRRDAGDGCDRIEGGEGVKVYGMRWDRDVGIVSAGEDRKVQIDHLRHSA